MNIEVNELKVNEYESGPIECPVCGWQGGGVSCVSHDDEETLLIMYCDHGHEYELWLSNIPDSIRTFAWTVKALAGREERPDHE